MIYIKTQNMHILMHMSVHQFDLGDKAVDISKVASATKQSIPGEKWNDLEHMKSAYTSDILPMPDVSYKFYTLTKSI